MPGVLNMLLAAGTGFAINAQNASASDGELFPTDATSALSFQTDGAVVATGNGAGTNFQLVTAGDPTLLEIFVSGTGDSPSGAALSTWLSLGSTRTFTLTQTGLGILSFSGTYQVRVAATGIVLGSASFDLSSTSDV